MKGKEASVKPKKFSYAHIQAVGTSDDRRVRKEAFVEYFAQFHDFPTYLFDNEKEIDKKLHETFQDLLGDKTTSQDMRAGVDAALNRLSFRFSK